jgi:hypothetical protein
MSGDIHDPDGHVTYTPFRDDDLGRVGYRVLEEGTNRETFLYLVPSSGSDDGVPTVFVYQGPANDPGQDMPEVHIELDFPR